MTTTNVNRPTDDKVKEADVNRKLQVYGIVSAFQAGKVPSNEQIDIALNSFLKSKPMASPSTKLSTEGQALVNDARKVVEQAKYLLLTKNEGNLLQDFIWQSEHLDGGAAALPGAPVDKATAQQHGNQTLDGLRTLGMLILSNGQFRKLLNDASILARDIMGDAASNAATRVKPSHDQLNQLDSPAEDNVWHDTPDLSTGNIKNQIKTSVSKNTPVGRNDLQQAAGDASQVAHPSGSRDPADAAQLGAHDQQHGTASGVDAQSGVQAGIATLKDRASENTSEETKDKARDTKKRTKNYLNEKMPEERRDQTIWRLKKMVVEIQGHQDYQRAIETLLSLAEQYSGHGKNLGQQGKGSVQGFLSENKWLTNLKTLLERFANNTSFDDLIESINQVYKDADQDPELKNWFTRINHFIRKTLQQQGFILEDRSNEEWNQIYDDGHRLLRGRYRGHTDRIADEFKFIGEQFDADPQNKQFAQSVNKLFLDLGQDENGQTVFKPHLLKDLSDVILPSIFENVRYVPIPRIEYSDSMVDAVVENLVIEGDNLAPNSLEFGSDNYWRWGRKSISSKNKNKVMLSVSGVQMDLRDVSYYIKRKQGFPSITDKGVMDIFMGGSGFSFKVEMETADKARENHAQTHFFKVTKVESDIKNLQIKMKKSNHKLLFNMFKPLLLKVMRPVIQKVLEKQIKDSANQLDGILFDIKTEADRAEAEAKRNPDPQNLQNMYQRYASAMQHRVMQGKQKKEQVKEKASDTQVNMAVTQHDSIFKNISLPGGISSKATEYKELAAKGERWESPIFSIGSAKETSSLPQVGKVTRKPHGRAGGYGSPGDESRGLGASQGLNPSANQYDSQYSNAGGLGAGQGLTSGQGLTGGSGLTGGQGLTGGSGLTGGQGLTGGSGLAGGQGLTGGVPSTTGGSHGFGTQVDDAFNTSGTGAPVGSSGLGSSGLGSSGLDSTGLNNPAATTTGSTTHPTGAPASGEFNTTFGDQNPVFQGRA